MLALVWAAPPPAGAEALQASQADTNSQFIANALFQVEALVRSNQLALEQNAREARETAARNADALARGLQQVESAYVAQQQALAARSSHDLQTVQRSNRTTLLVAGGLGMLACVALGIMSWLQWRIARAWSGMTALWSGSPPGAAGAVQDSNRRLLGAMERLETRLQQLERGVTPALKAPNGSQSKEGNGGPGPEFAEAAEEPGRIASLLGEGKTRLKENDLESALRCFEEVLVLAPNHGEALVKKGAALERLQKLNEAFECYDRAIAADQSMTIAYLHKGGLCNRLERFKEALECYEKALRTQERHG